MPRFLNFKKRFSYFHENLFKDFPWTQKTGAVVLRMEFFIWYRLENYLHILPFPCYLKMQIHGQIFMYQNHYRENEIKNLTVLIINVILQILVQKIVKCNPKFCIKSNVLKSLGSEVNFFMLSLYIEKWLWTEQRQLYCRDPVRGMQWVQFLLSISRYVSPIRTVNFANVTGSFREIFFLLWEVFITLVSRGPSRGQRVTQNRYFSLLTNTNNFYKWYFVEIFRN